MSSSKANVLIVEPLTGAAFAPFGDVISAAASTQMFFINDGTAQRFHALGNVDCSDQNGHPVISVVRAQPRALPFEICMLERHPLGSQAFVPQSTAGYLVVVAESPTHAPRAFFAANGAGVNFHRGTWHHPLLALNAITDFIVIDRAGEGDNCEEVELATRYWLQGP